MYRIINEILPYSDENLCNHLKLIFDANITNMIDSQRYKTLQEIRDK